MAPLDEMPKCELHLSHRQYAQLLGLKADLSRIQPDGTFDDSQFIAEAMSQFNLRPYHEYRIVLDRD